MVEPILWPNAVRPCTGGVVVYGLGVLYLVVGLAILNELYFMPALGALTHRLRLSDDVAGELAIDLVICPCGAQHAPLTPQVEHYLHV